MGIIETLKNLTPEDIFNSHNSKELKIIINMITVYENEEEELDETNKKYTIV